MIADIVWSFGASVSADRWRDFYLLAGTGAVTLVGLLFVALSFHLETLLRDEKAHLLAAARLAFTSFVYVLIIALMFLLPGISLRMLVTLVLVLSLATLANTVWAAIAHRRHQDAAGLEDFMRRRYLLLGIVSGAAILAALRSLASSRDPELTTFGVVTALMLVNATGISWDLLVRVGKLKLQQGAGPRA